MFFEGYKKHTLYGLLPIGDGWRPIPLCSSVQPANVSEQRVIEPLLHFVHQCMQWPFAFLVTDQGYVNAPLARFLRQQWHVAHIVRPKSNMNPPQGTDPDGCPLCPLGERLVWIEYDLPSGRLIYREDPRSCPMCPLRGTCPRQFEYPAGLSETFWGMVPKHSRLWHHLMQKFRPRVEPGFNLTKNKYGVTDFFLNSRHLTRALSILNDTLETLEILAVERPSRPHQTRKALIGDIFQPEL